MGMLIRMLLVVSKKRSDPGGYLNWKPYVEFVYVGQPFVGGTDVVGGVPSPTRTIVGPPHLTRSPLALPVARVVRMKRTLLPANGVKSTLAVWFFLSFCSRHVQKLKMPPLGVI